MGQMVRKKTTTMLTALLLLVTAGSSVAETNEARQRTPLMPRMMDMMPPCSQMMAQMGGMGGMAPQPRSQPREGREPTEHGTKQGGGLEVTLLSAPPLSPAEMQRMMPGMGGMGGMQGMGGMMRGKPEMGMGERQAEPTHWMGVVVRDLDDRAVQDLDITLTAKRGGLTRTVKLMPMPGSYGANISLPEKGRYTVMVAVARAGQPVSVTFDFDYEYA